MQHVYGADPVGPESMVASTFTPPTSAGECPRPAIGCPSETGQRTGLAKYKARPGLSLRTQYPGQGVTMVLRLHSWFDSADPRPRSTTCRTLPPTITTNDE
jgi:hypothetical protein